MDSQAVTDRLREWRRYLHSNPELSGEEAETAAYLAAELRKLGIEPEVGVGGTHGLTATIGPRGPSAVALRADIDALPIREETGLPFASGNDGVMHACGHDAHMSMLLGAAALLKQRERDLPRPVRLIFQPSEEKLPGGAKPMIEAGVLDGVTAICGLHIWSLLPAGTLGLCAGPFMASVDDIEIVIKGRGGHAAMPENCVDPIVAAAQVILALQTAISRNIGLNDGAVLTITRVEAGTANNIIPPQAVLRGTLRTLDEAVRRRVRERIGEIARGVATANGADAQVTLTAGYPVLVNDAGTVAAVRRAAEGLGWDVTKIRQMAPIGGGEDFAYYGQQVPAAFAFLGGGNEAEDCVYPHHHPRFNIDEAALPFGAALLAAWALDTGAA